MLVEEEYCMQWKRCLFGSSQSISLKHWWMDFIILKIASNIISCNLPWKVVPLCNCSSSYNFSLLHFSLVISISWSTSLTNENNWSFFSSQCSVKYVCILCLFNLLFLSFAYPLLLIFLRYMIIHLFSYTFVHMYVTYNRYFSLDVWYT